MKSTFFFRLICVAALLCWAGVLPTRADTLTFINNGQTEYSIVVPAASADKERNKAINLAANLLQTNLQKAGGAKLPIVAEDKLAAGAPAIYLGKTRAAKEAGLPLDEISGWTTLETVRGKNLFLIGNDGASAIQAHFVYQGTLRAATSFLERLGVRFLLPGQEHGTFVPRLERVKIPTDLNALRRAPLTYITGRVPGDVVYADAQNYLRSDLYKSFGGHSYYTAVPAEKYAKSHPEYFILKNGVRTAVGNHLCISNPEVRALMLKTMETYFDAGYEWVELAQTDGYVPCECDKCRAINADPGERTWIFHRALAEEMEKRRPGKKVVIIAYGPTAQPPRSFHTFPDNVIIQMSHYAAEDFAQWKPYGNLPKTVYIYNWGSYNATGFGPMRTPRYVAEQARLFRENNVQGIYLCGGFESMGLEGPVFYTYGKALADPQSDEKQWTREFYSAAYGKAAAPMTEFFETLYSRLELFCALDRPNFAAKSTPAFANKPEEIYSALYPPEVLLKLAQSLETAQKLESDPDVQARLRLVAREFGYVQTLANVFNVYREYQAKPNWENFGKVENAVAARAEFISSWYDEAGKKKSFDGFPNFLGSPANSKSNVLAGGKNAAVLHAPFDWSFAELRKTQFLPGVTQLKVREMEAPRLPSLKLTGKANDPAWSKAPQVELVETNLRQLNNGTKFRAGYDDANLYLAFECERDQMEKYKPISAGKDGKTYAMDAQDELEVSVYVGEGKYYRFFFNPAPDSTFDGRYGFITDGLDPRYGKWDNDWDGKWNYAFDIDRAHNRWTAEVQIPFATIGVTPPQTGDTLQVSVRRVNFLYEPDKLGWAPGGANTPVVSTWTGSGYKDYGKIVFR